MARKSNASAAAKAVAPTPRTNQHRGEAAINLGGKSYKLVLTMNALVEIENAMGVPLARLGEVLAQPKMSQMRALLGALIRGGGADMTDEEIGAFPFSMGELERAVEATFSLAGVYDPNAEPDEDAKKKTLAS